eukprot:3770873-Rhodomonas_salina.2
MINIRNLSETENFSDSCSTRVRQLQRTHAWAASGPAMKRACWDREEGRGFVRWGAQQGTSQVTCEEET